MAEGGKISAIGENLKGAKTVDAEGAYVMQEERRRVSPHHYFKSPQEMRDLFADRSAFDDWMLSYSELLALDGKALAANLMLNTNPKFVLRNHLGEQAIRAAKLGDFSELQTLQRLLEHPFDEHPGHDAYAAFPPDWASSIEISCSS